MEDEVVGSPNAGNEWPTFDVPAEIPKDETPAAAPQADPVVPATSADAGAAGQPQAQPAAAPGGAADGETIPKYRLDEVLATNAQMKSALEARDRQINDLIARMPAATPATPAAEEAPQPSAQDLAIRERLVAVFPELKMLAELKDLAAQKDALLGAANASTRWTKAEEAHFDNYAVTSLAKTQDKIAVLMLGDGKAMADLPKMTQEAIVSGFTRFVTSDPKRAARYEANDTTVIDEFVGAYKVAHIDPLRRDTNAALLARANQPPAVPAGGGSAPVSHAQPPSVNNLDEDAVHARAWANRDSVGV